MRRFLSSIVFPSTILALISSLAVLPGYLKKPAPAAPNEAKLDPSSCQVDTYSKVSLCWNADDSIFPEAKKYAMGATSLDLPERQRSLEVITKVLRRYPAPLLQRNLTAVFLVKSLHFRGVSASGTYGSDCIYIANGGEEAGYTKQWIAQTFHEEFSSELLWRHPGVFSDTAWKACNAPGFHYLADGVDAIKKGTSSTLPQSRWWPKGFISQYATASVEEDFNQVVKYLFSHPANERPALAASPRLRQKAALAKAFYAKIGMNIDAPTSTATESTPTPKPTVAPTAEK